MITLYCVLYCSLGTFAWIPMYHGTNSELIEKIDRITWPSLSSTNTPIFKYVHNTYSLKDQKIPQSHFFYKYSINELPKVDIKPEEEFPKKHNEEEKVSLDFAQHTLNGHDLKKLRKLLGTNSFEETVNYLKQLVNEPQAINQIKSYLESAEIVEIPATLKPDHFEKDEKSTLESSELYDLDLEVIEKFDILKNKDDGKRTTEGNYSNRRRFLQYPLPLWNSKRVNSFKINNQIKPQPKIHLNTPKVIPSNSTENAANYKPRIVLADGNNNKIHHNVQHLDSTVNNSTTSDKFADINNKKIHHNVGHLNSTDNGTKDWNKFFYKIIQSTFH